MKSMSVTPEAGVEAGRPAAPAGVESWAGRLLAFGRRYAVLILLVGLFVTLSVSTSSFLTVTNLINIINQNAPLAIIAVAGTLVIICGGFDLSTGAIFSVANVVAAWVAVHLASPVLGLLSAPVVGAVLGLINGFAITRLKIHSFLATLASSLVYAGLAVLITGGFLISVGGTSFTALGRGGIGPVYYAVFILLVFALASGFLLTHTTFGRYVLSVGGNPEAAELSGVRVDRVKLYTFLYSGLAAGIAAAIGVSRIGSGQPQAGNGLQLLAIAAVILGGTSIYGGVGAVWRSVCGVYLLALIDNGFDILNANPFFKDLTTGAVILAAVALSATRKRR
jgi:ribose transport system permease protein